MMVNAAEGDRLSDVCQALEWTLLEAQIEARRSQETFRPGFSQGDSASSAVKSILSNDLDHFFQDLDGFLNQLRDQRTRIQAFQLRCGRKQDLSSPVVVVNADDLRTLERNHHFVDGLSRENLLQIAVVLAQREALLNDLKHRAKTESYPSAALLQAKEALDELGFLAPAQRVALLLEESPLLACELRYLVLSLRFLSPAYVRQQGAYPEILVLFRGDADATKLNELWQTIDKHLKSYKPSNFKRNYGKAYRALCEEMDSRS